MDIDALTPVAAMVTLRGRCSGGKLGRGAIRRKLRDAINVHLKETWKYGAAVEKALPGTTLGDFNDGYPMHHMRDTRAEVDRLFVEALRVFPELKDENTGGSAIFVIRHYGSDALKALLPELQEGRL
jgi:hypothetical protein